MIHTNKQLQERVLDLAWSLWTGIGVPGQIDNHKTFAIDPEPLIIFTTALGDLDPRLRDEATDWCINYGGLVSGTRLKNLLKGEPDYIVHNFGEFAATVAEHSSLRWPNRTSAREHLPRSRPKIPSFNRASQLLLRMRGVLGTCARAEIIRVFMASPKTTFSAADLAAKTNFTKRNIAQTLDTLKLAAMVQTFQVRNQIHYQIPHDRLGLLAAQFKPIPKNSIRWPLLLRIVTNSFNALSLFENKSKLIRSIEIRSVFDSLSQDIRLVGLTEPRSDIIGTSFWDEFKFWFHNTIDNLAKGIIP